MRDDACRNEDALGVMLSRPIFFEVFRVVRFTLSRCVPAPPRLATSEQLLGYGFGVVAADVKLHHAMRREASVALVQDTVRKRAAVVVDADVDTDV
jgi:hypothetical protein